MSKTANMGRLLVFLLLLILCEVVNGQVISTIAGDGSATNGADGIAATACGLNVPQAIYCDKKGNIYTEGGNRLRKIDTAGIITTIGGTGIFGYTGDGAVATLARINNITSFAADKLGNIYVRQGATVRKIDTFGIITTVAGTGVPGHSGDGGPATAAMMRGVMGIAIDDTGNIYIADNGAHCIRKVNRLGIINTIAGTPDTAGYSVDGTIAGAAYIRDPRSICVDDSGHIYFAEGGNYRVRKIDVRTGRLSTLAGGGPVYPMSGSYSGDDVAATSVSFLNVIYIALDAAKNLYISCGGQHVVRRVGADGVIRKYAGTGVMGYSGDGGAATAATLNATQGIYVDDTGNVYIADRYNRRLRKVRVHNSIPKVLQEDTPVVVVCRDSTVNIDTQLTVEELNSGQELRWELHGGPLHGTATGSYSVLATGGVMQPVGMQYEPSAGYVGGDTLRYKVNDGLSAVYVTVYVRVDTVGCMPVGASEFLADDRVGLLRIWPQPSAGGAFSIAYMRAGVEVRVQVTDAMGRRVYEEAVPGGTAYKISLPLVPGVYSVQARAGEHYERQLLLVQ